MADDVVNGLNNKVMPQGIINRADSFSAFHNKAKAGNGSAGNPALINAVGNVRGMGDVSGPVPLSYAARNSDSVLTKRNSAVKATVAAGKELSEGGAGLAVSKGIDVVSAPALRTASLMEKSGDDTLRGFGTAYKRTHNTVKTGYSVGKRVVKTGIRTGKVAIRTVNAGRRVVKAAMTVAKTAKSAVVAVKSVVAVKTVVVKVKSAVVGVKALTVKAAPVLIAVGLIAVVILLVASPLVGASSLFGGVFTTVEERDPGNPDVGGESTEHQVRDFLLSDSGVPELRDRLVDSVASQLAGGGHDTSRLYVGPFVLVNPNSGDIANVLPTVEELATHLQPVFNVMLLMEYGLNVSEERAYELLAEMFDAVLEVSLFSDIEWCGQSEIDGRGAPVVHAQCGQVHALDHCPNPDEGTHKDYTCSLCCDFLCDGHEPGDDGDEDDIYDGLVYCFSGSDMENCDNRSDFICFGYSICGSHSVMTADLFFGGVDSLMAAHFINPMAELEGDPGRSAELRDFRGYLEIANIIRDMVFDDFAYTLSFGGSRVGWYVGDGADGDVFTDALVSPFYHFWQWGGHWADMRYGPPGASTYSGGGCYPTSYAMIISSLTGDIVYPDQIGAFITSIGMRVPGVGTAHGATEPVMKRWGLSAVHIGNDSAAVVDALSSGQLIFFSVGSQPTNTFTNGGHGLVMRGLTGGGKVIVACSARRAVNNHAFDLGFVLKHARTGNVWAISN
jgi:hypothetical protein